MLSETNMKRDLVISHKDFHSISFSLHLIVSLGHLWNILTQKISFLSLTSVRERQSRLNEPHVTNKITWFFQFLGLSKDV